MDSFPLCFYTRGRVVFSDGCRALLPVGGGACRWVWRMRCADMGPALAEGAGAQEGFAGHPGVPKGPAALSLLDLLLTRDLSPPDGLSPRHWLHTQVGRVPLGRKGKDGHWFPCKRPYYPDNELKTPPAVGPPGTLRLGLHPQPVLC